MNEKNHWTGASTKKLLNSERELLKLIGITEYDLGFVALDGMDNKLHIHYLRIGKVSVLMKIERNAQDDPDSWVRWWLPHSLPHSQDARPVL